MLTTLTDGLKSGIYFATLPNNRFLIMSRDLIGNGVDVPAACVLVLKHEKNLFYTEAFLESDDFLTGLEVASNRMFE